MSDLDTEIPSEEPIPLYASPYLAKTSSHVTNIVSSNSYELNQEPGRTLAGLRPGQALTWADAATLRPHLRELLLDQWLFESVDAMFRAYRLRYVSLETATVCNQRCYFCPVSQDPRPNVKMDDGLLARVLGEIESFPHLAGVYLNNYNEPFIDPRAPAIISYLHARDIKVAINSNGSVKLSSLNPELPQGSIYLLTFNLDTADRDKYRRNRGRDHLERVERNIADFALSGVAVSTRIAVLGDMSPEHQAEKEAIEARFAGLPLACEMFAIMDRAGNLNCVGKDPIHREFLLGCDQMGSRPLEHVHILPDGRCVLCCEDYYERHVVGDVSRQSIHEIMSDDPLAAYRRQIYGYAEPQADLLCKHCEYAVEGSGIRMVGCPARGQANSDERGDRGAQS